MVIIVSDFLDSSPWAREIRALSHRHSVFAIEILDPREMDLPPVGVLAVVDPETGRRRRIDTNSSKLRARFAEAAAEQRQQIAGALAAAGADHLQLRTDEDWVLALVDHMRLARERARHGARP